MKLTLLASGVITFILAPGPVSNTDKSPVDSGAFIVVAAFVGVGVVILLVVMLSRKKG